MNKFKNGDKVRIIKSRNLTAKTEFIGKEYIVESLDGEFYILKGEHEWGWYEDELELTTDKNKQFTKSDLKTGMWIELRDGDKGMVLLNTNSGDIFSGHDLWGSLSEYKDDLTSKHSKQFDVVRIYQPSANRYYYNIEIGIGLKTIWQREEKPKNTIEQSVIRTFTYNNETITLVHKDNWTSVRLQDGTMSKCRCHPEDVFDREKGTELAYYRAKKKQAENAIDRMIKAGL